MKRFTVVLVAVGLVAAIAAGTAAALRFTDDDYIWADGEVGTPYFKQLNAAAGCTPYKFSVLAGSSLPDGLSLASDGKVTGVPQKLGSWTFWLQLRGAGCPSDPTAEREFTMSVTRIKVTVQTRSLPDAIRGAPYPTQSLQAVGGSGSGYTWSLSNGSLPGGLTLNQNGTISGAPTANGVSIFTVLATDSGGRTDTKQLSISVVDPLAASVSPRVAEVGLPFTSIVKPSGGTPAYSVTTAGIPAGLAYDSQGGVISGTPAVAGTFRLEVSITDAHGLATTNVVKLVVVPRLVISTKKLPGAAAGTPYKAKLPVAGGARPLKWSAGGLPQGIHLRAATGTLTGVPAVAGTYHVRLKVRDALGASSSRTLTFVVS